MKENKEGGLNVTLHVAGGISYNHKGDLIFYNDLAEPAAIRTHNKARLHKSSVKSEAEYQRKVEEWKASLPHDLEIRSTGNSMTQLYYTENILPHHINTMQSLEKRYGVRY